MSNNPTSPKDDQSLPAPTNAGSDPNKEHIEIANIISIPLADHIKNKQDGPFIDSYVGALIRQGKMPGGAEGETIKKRAAKEKEIDESHVIK